MFLQGDQWLQRRTSGIFLGSSTENRIKLVWCAPPPPWKHILMKTDDVADVLTSWRLDQNLLHPPLDYQNNNSLISNWSDYTSTSLAYIQSLHPKAVQMIIKVPMAPVPDFLGLPNRWLCWLSRDTNRGDHIYWFFKVRGLGVVRPDSFQPK